MCLNLAHRHNSYETVLFAKFLFSCWHQVQILPDMVSLPLINSAIVECKFVLFVWCFATTRWHLWLLIKAHREGLSAAGSHLLQKSRLTARATSSHLGLVTTAARGPGKSVHLCRQWKNGRKSTAARGRGDTKVEGSWVIFMDIEAMSLAAAAL